MLKISASILSADFAHLADEIADAEAAGVDGLHIDVMDGHFVPNITIGPFIVEAIKRTATAPLDVHLMISDPAKFIGAFLDAGADSIDFHIEVVAEPDRLVETIHRRGAKAGLSLSPETPVEAVAGFLERVEQIMVMTVHPGFGGQELIPECVEKVRRLAAAAEALDIFVDGGINRSTIATAAQAGANVFVAGTAVFGQKDRAAAIAGLRRLAEQARPGGRPPRLREHRGR